MYYHDLPRKYFDIQGSEISNVKDFLRPPLSHICDPETVFDCFDEGMAGRIGDMGLVGRVVGDDMVFLYGGELGTFRGVNHYALGILTTERMIKWDAPREGRFDSQGFLAGCSEDLVWPARATPSSPQAQEFVHDLERLLDKR